ncbi:hypothetical protein K9U39_00780 [Rhodoblastus acidophilus]|uniref:Flagellar protein FliL n=1 Tax=Candidatus Rhodoblastus alkanivorans TaxID=2954117 RepID=A0ABS9Z6D0_9HYPH|nr:hypothetical protein [Candidatus Rhodoblastus alkanivorans]MCI4678803.1 hypothetical protein [Candidatus Rhodoblastus alkanivorans]MCI4682192.1 hypothetical protein [Candidatus Rhodoblastus alkanivorans]MDI4639494.1 hypothetical protein [Rhodoblastus acidophilus]
MVKLLILALWVSAITAFSSYEAGQWRVARATAAHDEATEHNYEYRKSRVINVPVIADGALLGYVIVQFLYAIDARQAERLNVNPEAFVLDYAFRTIYGDPSLDFRHLDKYDINALTSQIRTVVNEKLGKGLIKEVLVQDFAYMPKDQMPQ